MLVIVYNLFLWSVSALILFLGLFSIVKKRFLEFFFPAILFLPDFYGFDVLPSLPLLSVKRIIFIILYVYLFVVYRKEYSAGLKKVRFTPEKICLLIYFAVRIITNCYYIFTYSQPLKTILVLVFEQVLLVMCLILIDITPERWTSIIKSIVYTSAVIFTMGFLESITGYRIADSLYTVSRFVPNFHFTRAGLLRATVTLEMPTLLGNACVMIIPLIMYLYEKTHEKKYLFISFLCVLCCVHSGTRSSLLFMIVIVLSAIVLYIKDSARLFKYLLHVFIITFSIVFLFVVLSLSSKNLKYYYVSFGKSLLNVIGFDYNLDEGAPSGSDGYGSNKDGSLSRTRQLTGIKYAADINPVFGLGSGAQLRGDVNYLSNGKWTPSHTYDLGYVEVFCDEGLLGWIAYLSLFISLTLPFFRRTYNLKNNKFGKYVFLGIFSYLLCMFSSASMPAFLFLYVVLVHCNLLKSESGIS